MFRLLPQFILMAAIITVIVIVLRRLPQVTFREEDSKTQSKLVARGEGQSPDGTRRGLKDVLEALAVSLRTVFKKASNISSLSLPKVNPVKKITRMFDPVSRSLSRAQQKFQASEVPVAEPSKLNDFQAAEQALIKIIQGSPTDRKAYEDLGKLYLDKKKYQDAAEVYRYLTKHYPRNDAYYSKLGLVYFNLGHYDAAILAYSKALELNPHSGPRLINLGLCYEARGDIDGAMKMVGRALEEEPNSVEYMSLLSDFLVRVNKKTRAVELLEKILELEPTNELAREKLMKVKF